MRSLDLATPICSEEPPRTFLEREARDWTPWASPGERKVPEKSVSREYLGQFKTLEEIHA